MSYFRYSTIGSDTNKKMKELFVEDIALSELAEKYNTPCYIYSYNSLINRYQRFTRAVGDALVCYSVKANDNLAIIRCLGLQGAGADIVSGGELKRVIAAGIVPSKIVFSGVGKTAIEISDALDAQIGQFNVESESELALLAEIAGQKGVVAPVSLRVNPDVDAKTHEKISTGRAQDKFGINLDKVEQLFVDGTQMNAIRIEGLAIHIGSQLSEITPFEDAFKTVGHLCKKLRAGGKPIDRIDLGGGLGISYDGKDELTLSSYGDLVKRTSRDLNAKIILEPGRWMVGPTGVVITKVIRMKSQGNKLFAIVDMAMNDLLRPALYGAWHNIEPVKASPDNPRALVDFVGPICESGDTIGINRPISGLKVNDLVVVRDAGAYGSVMSSNYNSRLTAAEIIVNGNKTDIIRPRLTYKSMLDRDTIPNWLKASN